MNRCFTGIYFYISISLTSSAIIKSASVFFTTSSTVKPGATSINTNPLSVIFITALSVIIISTHFAADKGKLHFFKTFELPFLSL